ncbi:hypothetical protein OA88_14080 [Flavobacterium sp. JRM]|nr:hypothetical protein OA88_14080 [Flavobacterium sp. JRM]
MKVTDLDLTIVLSLLLLISFGLFGMEYFLLSSALIILVLFKANPSTAGVFLIWFFFNISGLWGTIFNIPKTGFIIFLLALGCFYVSEYNHKINFKEAFFKFLPIVFLFFIFFILGPMHSYSMEKMIYIVYKGFFFIICFLVLLLNPHINFIKITVLILLAVFQYYSYMQITLNWSGPDFFTDFGSYRRFFVSNSGKLKDKLINYQEIGLLAVIAFGFLLNFIPSKKTLKKNDIFFYSTMAICLLVILYSGSRQSLYSLPIIYFIHLFFNEKVNKIMLIRNSIIGCLAVFLFLFTELNNKDSVFKESSGNTIAEQINRPEEILHAFELIKSKPLLGSGLGGFATSYNNNRYYPHNIFLELLSEIGFVGTLILLLYIITILRKKQVSIKGHAYSGFMIMPIFTALFIRANLSSDLIETVCIFSFLIAWSAMNNFNNIKTI